MPSINWSKLPVAPWQGIQSVTCPHDHHHAVTAARILAQDSVKRRAHQSAEWVVRCDHCRRPVLILTHQPQLT